MYLNFLLPDVLTQRPLMQTAEDSPCKPQPYAACSDTASHRFWGSDSVFRYVPGKTPAEEREDARRVG